ncbi:MAG: P-II family nitrogen regulator [Methanoregula sp.]|nr:P-II family nitrogen regulator [Methanoregula sp.]
MIWAIIQSTSTQMVIDALEKVGIQAMTRMETTCYDKEPGIPARAIEYTEISREMLMIVLADHDVAKAVTTIRTAVKKSFKEDQGTKTPVNGKIFVTYVEDFYSIRIAQKISGTILHEKNYCHHTK